MDKKQKIELAIISGLFLLGLTGIFLIYNSRVQKQQSAVFREEILMDPMVWSQAEEYQLEKTDLGTKINHRSTKLEIVLPENWLVEVLPAGTSPDGASVKAITKGSILDQNQIIREGCSIDLKFARAPLRHRLAQEKIEKIGEETIYGIREKRLVPLASLRAILRSSVTQNGHYFADITAPLDDSHLLDASLIFSRDYSLECQKQILRVLASAQIK